MSNRHCTVMPDTRTTSGSSSFNDHERQMFLVPLHRWQLGTAAIRLPSCSQGIASFAFDSYNSLSFPPHPNLKQPLPWLSGIYNLSFIFVSNIPHLQTVNCVSHSRRYRAHPICSQQSPPAGFFLGLPLRVQHSPTQLEMIAILLPPLWLVPCPWFL